MRLAKSRRRMLCCWLPVKYWSIAPMDSVSPVRRSICNPGSTTTLVLRGPLTSTSLTCGSAARQRPNSSGCGVIATRSTSPMVSSHRRRLPAGVSRVMAGSCWRRAAMTDSAAGRA